MKTFELLIKLMFASAALIVALSFAQLVFKGPPEIYVSPGGSGPRNSLHIDLN